MKIEDRVYDVLKWICLICLPSLSSCYMALGQIWNFPFVEEIPKTIMVLDTLLGALLGISSATYYKNLNKIDPNDYEE